MTYLASTMQPRDKRRAVRALIEQAKGNDTTATNLADTDGHAIGCYASRSMARKARETARALLRE